MLGYSKPFLVVMLGFSKHLRLWLEKTGGALGSHLSLRAQWTRDFLQQRLDWSNAL